jgi:hypothetical protein
MYNLWVGEDKRDAWIAHVKIKHIHVGVLIPRLGIQPDVLGVVVD